MTRWGHRWWRGGGKYSRTEAAAQAVARGTLEDTESVAQAGAQARAHDIEAPHRQWHVAHTLSQRR